ncbi:MAG TPA: hypothetical protein VN954_00145 [Ktedonobacteraceae bacterium]|nr:hypothetical protein [Ktedonobacteraceae bacterium]
MRADAYLEPVLIVELLRLHLLNRDEIVWDIVERTESIVVLLMGQKQNMVRLMRSTISM